MQTACPNGGTSGRCGSGGGWPGRLDCPFVGTGTGTGTGRGYGPREDSPVWAVWRQGRTTRRGRWENVDDRFARPAGERLLRWLQSQAPDGPVPPGGQDVLPHQNSRRGPHSRTCLLFVRSYPYTVEIFTSPPSDLTGHFMTETVRNRDQPVRYSGGRWISVVRRSEYRIGLPSPDYTAPIIVRKCNCGGLTLATRAASRIVLHTEPTPQRIVRAQSDSAV